MAQAKEVNLGEYAQKGHPNSRKGTHISEEQRQKLREARQRQHLEGRDSFLGHSHSPETKAILSQKMHQIKSASPNAFWTGKKFSMLHIQKISESKKRYVFTEEHKQNLKRARLNQILPQKDTKIELKLQYQLTNAGLIFQTHKSLRGQPDIYIPSKNLCIFADGCYWHGCKEHGKEYFVKRYYTDFRIKHELELEGYKVVRLWEHDINKPNFDIQRYFQ